MARERYVPTPQEVEEGFDPGITRQRRGPFKKLRDAIAPKRVAKHDVRLRDGVGEMRQVSPAPRVDVGRSEATPREVQASPARPTVIPAPPQASRAASADRQPPVAGGHARRPRRTVRVAEDVLPPAESESTSADVDGRMGSWPPNLSDEEIRRRIGSMQRYGEDT